MNQPDTTEPLVLPERKGIKERLALKRVELKDRLFNLDQYKTTFKSEFLSGFNIFVAMSYIVLVNPQIMGDAGMPRNGAYIVTILAAFTGCIIMAIAGIPYGVAPRMGINAFFSYTICVQLGFHWKEALAMVFASGVFSYFAPILKLHIGLPKNLKYSISSGIGLFIAYTGIKNSGFLKFTGTSAGSSMGVSTFPSLVNFSDGRVLLAIVGLLITIGIMVFSWQKRKTNYSLIGGMIATTAIGALVGVITFPENFSIIDGSSFGEVKEIVSSFWGDPGLLSLWRSHQRWVIVIMTILTLTLTNIFDSIGTFGGLERRMQRIAGDLDSETDREKAISAKTDRALKADSISTAIGALLGASNTGAFIESEIGITSGARTGWTSFFTACFFLLPLLVTNLVSIVPVEATSPALILVGVFLMSDVGKIEWRNIPEAIPAFFTMVFIALSYNITYGIAVGFIIYCVVETIQGNIGKIPPNVRWTTCAFLAMFIYISIQRL